MTKLFLLCLVIFTIIAAGTQAQNLTQSVKGFVYEKETHIPLPGVNVLIVGSNPVLGSVTREDGSFIINNVPVGRCKIRLSFRYP